MNDQQRKAIDEITKKLTDEGRLIEAGWRSLQIVLFPNGASQIQLKEMRKAYFAGAQHLYASIMAFMEEGEEPTDTDMRRMASIDNELKFFADELKHEISGERSN